MNLNYRFQFDDPSRREAADPVIEYFKGKYYLFASKSGGYWSSPDLSEWTYIPCKTITTIEHYAPTILVMDDALYFMSSSEPKIFKNTNPDIDNWEDIHSKFEFQIAGSVDPAFFKDDDGRVYMYWGCSDKDPIIGVEVDPKDAFKVKAEAKILITHQPDKYGWEVPGDNNEEDRNGYNEGPCMIKYKGKYYLQYAAPGTQYRVYGDGIYISDNPLGPYTYVENGPFSFKPGGFIGGAGHGHTFKDKYGNYWHVATMKISVRHMFERRLGLFPAYMASDDNMYAHTVLTDYPFHIPDQKADMENNDCSMKWNLLSCAKDISSSSSLPGYEARYANDEKVETWWSSQSGKAGEWLEIDLGKEMLVNALQVNFADQDFSLKATDVRPYYQYYIEGSQDRSSWSIIADRRSNTKDMVHELIVLNSPSKTRYIRIKNTKDMEGKFSISDFRVFGHGQGESPAEVSNLRVFRNKHDKRIINLGWDKVENATGYIIRWGVNKDYLKNATMIYSDTHFEGRFFNRNSKYYFSIDSFNENGITKNEKIYSTSE
ncbi:family 43 glycosylhydrolase [Prevotella sp. 10(H)]|uniref:family 43 glycosylhydrolase n=1 Tax=Prevotella sp. 10(H) TaxID=1158294 RepID=UPI000B08E3DD|nr:family 43 glycosylhydrolase [Prevotella sp. 10(H)]